MIYKLYIRQPNTLADAAYYIDEQDRMVSFIFDNANTDFVKFKADIANGSELQDAEGNVMTKKDVTAFLATLPADEPTGADNV